MKSLLGIKEELSDTRKRLSTLDISLVDINRVRKRTTYLFFKDCVNYLKLRSKDLNKKDLRDILILIYSIIELKYGYGSAYLSNRALESLSLVISEEIKDDNE